MYDRPAGLAGIWGSLIRDWLEELLPADAAERCAGRVRLVVTEVPSLRIRYLENFESKQDLIDANSESLMGGGCCSSLLRPLRQDMLPALLAHAFLNCYWRPKAEGCLYCPLRHVLLTTRLHPRPSIPRSGLCAHPLLPRRQPHPLLPRPCLHRRLAVGLCDVWQLKAGHLRGAGLRHRLCELLMKRNARALNKATGGSRW